MYFINLSINYFSTPDSDMIILILCFQLMKNDKIMFDAADSNKDGMLNKQEFAWFSHPEEHPEMLPLILQNTLDDKDTDKNGVIDFQEFLGERGKP